jgi:hypothetical protein
MEASILKSTKKILGIDASYTAFDLDILTHLNAAFSILTQLGIGPEYGFVVESEDETWDDFVVSQPQKGLIKTYLYLKVRFLFDPPGTGYLVEAASNQIKEYEWRLTTMRDEPLEVEPT